MSATEQFDNINAEIEDAKVYVKRAEALKRLMKNKDFDNLFIEGYLTTYAADQVRSKAKPHFQTPEMQKSFDNSLTAIGCFDQYLAVVLANGEAAKATIESAEYTRNELLEEME